MTAQLPIETYLLAQMINEQVGEQGRRQLSQLRFLRDHVNFEFDLAGEQDIYDVRWTQIDSDEPGVIIIELDLPEKAKRKRFSVIDQSYDGPPLGSLTGERDSLVNVERLPISEGLLLRVDKTAIKRKRKALSLWQDTRHPERVGFYRIFEAERYVNWPQVEQVEVPRWHFLTDESRPGSALQREFVCKALGTPDFAFLDGPPGSGKTTVICELVTQIVERGGRVLLCGQTHESVDNVLERLTDSTGTPIGDVMPLRLASKQTKKKASLAAQRYFKEEITETIAYGVRDVLESISAKSHSQEVMLSALTGDRRDLEKFLIDAANVLCGTTLGIVADDLLATYFETGEPIFDFLIVDEASKLTLAEFMIPALLSRRWILSGDPMQLPPYEDSDETAAWLAHTAGMHFDEMPENSREPFKNLAADISRSFSLRFVESRANSLNPEEAIDRRMGREVPAFVDKLKADVPKLIRLGMTSCLEQLIVRREPDGILHEERYTGAVDVGLPLPALRSRLTKLEYQQRMHPQISEIVRDSVYQGLAMNDMPEMSDRRVWGYSRYPRRAVFISARPVSSNEAEENKKPESPQQRYQRPQQIAEASVGANELKAFIEWVDSEDKSGKDWTVALLSFYTDGVSEIRKVLQKRFGAQFEGGEAELGVSNRVKVKIATIDSVQGREADVVLLHVGNSKLTSFNKSINRVNVALTRARYQLVVIGNRSDLARSGDTYLLSNLARNDEIFWAHGV